MRGATTGADGVRIGAHVSISRGFAGAAREAAGVGCEAMQVFSRSPRGGPAKPLDERDVLQMTILLQEAGIRPLVVHTPYFVNLASVDPHTYGYSRDVLVEDLRRASALGALFLVTHPGHRPLDSADALKRIAEAVSLAIGECPGNTRVLIENTAGQGSEIGDRFEEIAGILDLIGVPERTGLCVDTCHAFAAGYDIRSAAGVDGLLEAVDRCVGMENVHVAHLNDSLFHLGSKRDRHEHIGQGRIGLEGFRAFVRHPSLEGLTGIIETPVENGKASERDVRTLKDLRDR